MGDWNILTVSEGGTVSLIKSVTEDDARKIAQNLTPPWRVPVRVQPGEKQRFYSYHPDPGRISRIEAWGPGGVDLDIWKGYVPA